MPNKKTGENQCNFLITDTLSFLHKLGCELSIVYLSALWHKLIAEENKDLTLSEIALGLYEHVGCGPSAKSWTPNQPLKLAPKYSAKAVFWAKTREQNMC